MVKITAFIARSFHAQDDIKIRSIIEHLDSFRPLGFTWETAEKADMESVSQKVRDKIDGSNMFVGNSYSTTSDSRSV